MNYLNTKINDLKNLFKLEAVESGKWNFFFSVFSIKIIVTLCGIALFSFIEIFMDLGDYERNFSNAEAILIFMFSSVLLTPFVEELLFRLGLSNKLILQYFGVILLSTLANDLIYSTIVFITLSFFISYSKKNIYKLNYPVVLFSTFLFGIAHVSDRLININQSFIFIASYAVFLAIYYGISGYFFAIIRIRLGFWYSVLMHSMTNFMGTVIYFMYLPDLQNTLIKSVLWIVYISIPIYFVFLFFSSKFGKYSTKLTSKI
jgi:membrane protease YdiL (CAAX protease family)